MTPTVSVKPGFGRKPAIPKNLTVKNSSSGGKNVTSSSSALKSSATQTISTSTLSNECRSLAASSSDNFVPGQKPIEFTRDRTVTVEHGAFAAAGGKHQLESDMGMTKRSTERLLKQQAQMQQQQQMAMLNQLNAMYGNNNVQQSKTNWSDVITLFTTGLSSLFGGSGAEKGGKTDGAGSISSDPVLASMQNAKTPDELNSAISTATTKLNEVTQSLTDGNVALKNLQGQSGGLKTNWDNASSAVKENATAISQKQGEVSNNINRESASQMAMNAAQSQVDMLKSQLDSAGPAAKAGIEAALKEAEGQLNTKTTQYNEAVAARKQSQADLQTLQDKTEGLQNDEKTAKAAYEDNQQQIGAKQKEISTLEGQQKDLTAGIDAANQRMDELKGKEAKA